MTDEAGNHVDSVIAVHSLKNEGMAHFKIRSKTIRITGSLGST